MGKSGSSKEGDNNDNEAKKKHSSKSKSKSGPDSINPSSSTHKIRNSSGAHKHYLFNPSNLTWSTGLYCNGQEELNLKEWPFYENTKRIWEKAAEDYPPKTFMGTCKGDCCCGGQTDKTVTSPISDLSLSLEPISSSSFHSSSDCDGES